MAPANGHLLLPKIWRAARFAYEKASRAIRAKLPEPTQHTTLRYQPVYARINTHQPINKAAAIRQARSRYFSTRAAGAFVSAAKSSVQADAGAYRATRTHLPRSICVHPSSQFDRGTLAVLRGGYAIGAGRFGGARYFSHGPAAPAQVIQNVSQGVRAFFLSGQKIRFDGIDPRTGEKQYKAVSALQDQAGRKMTSIPRTASGSYLDFQLSPTITAFGALAAFGKEEGASTETLRSEGLMDLLSADFARAFKEFAIVLNDLKRLSALGDLPITLEDQSTLRVRFPGCDAETVERLCDEVGVQRGRVSQDEDFDLRTGADLALLFPFAPSMACSSDVEYLFEKPAKSCCASSRDLDWQDMLTPEGHMFSPNSGYDSGNGISFDDEELFCNNPWKSSSRSAYSSINISELGDRAFFQEASPASIPETTSEYDGSEGIHRFLAECDRARR
ncbi:hypothetical protein N7468_000499 [Penicillium chermesinum]|uniref:Casein kinase II beta 2 subunit n=1 Tax=Penicillium chermesinum TaxID=63820 RepID=A0A9W9TYE7_9EURO|nr:uncharacterized protein N7468_000499 [Penicillium chermesinum]KAJ5249048.1 hypothetical protein N7468_000499 [Penicillium chermesinum]